MAECCVFILDSFLLRAFFQRWPGSCFTRGSTRGERYAVDATGEFD